MLSQKTVQEIQEATRVEEIVGEFVTLKKAGANYKGLCPFHNEKTPSFSVNPARGIFKCFGCGKGGDAVGFLMEHENMSWLEAMKWLARRYRIEIEETQLTPEVLAERQLSDSLYIVNEFAQKFFDNQLFKTDIGRNVGLEYFKKRGFREDIIRKFGLGFAPDLRDELLKAAKLAQYSPDLLKKLGLVSQHDRDFFRNRVMFTIFNASGKPIAFAGRILQKDINAPKYINSPESEIYHKSRILYAMNFAKRDIAKLDECLLTEGYTDVISLHQAGIENVVASSGTSLTVEQIRLIQRFTKNITILYDGDAAGIKAALRGLDMVLAEDMNVRVVLLPQGEDPDSYVQKIGADAFRAYLKAEAKDFVLFKADLLLKETQNDPIQKSKVVKDIIGSISQIPDAIRRSVYIQQCSHLLKIDEQVLTVETKKNVLKKLEQQHKKRGQAASDTPPQYLPTEEPYSSASHHFPSEEPPPSENDIQQNSQQTPPTAPKNQSRDEFQERDIIRILVAFGSEKLTDVNAEITHYILENIKDVLEYFEVEKYKRIIIDLRTFLQTENTIPKNYFLSHPSKDVRALAVELLSEPWTYSENWEKRHGMPLVTQPMPDFNFERDARNALKRFKLRKIEKILTINQHRIKNASDASDMETLINAMRVQQHLVQVRNQLAKELNLVILK